MEREIQRRDSNLGSAANQSRRIAECHNNIMDPNFEKLQLIPDHCQVHAKQFPILEEYTRKGIVLKNMFLSAE